MNDWRSNPTSWLRNIEHYNQLRRNTGRGAKQRVHLYLKQTFSTHLVELCGCKPLVSALIQMPLHKSADPVKWCKVFLEAFQFLLLCYLII